MRLTITALKKQNEELKQENENLRETVNKWKEECRRVANRVRDDQPQAHLRQTWFYSKRHLR